MAPGSLPSFDDFAETAGMYVRGKCQVCALDADVLEQIHLAYAKGYRGQAIRRYLVEGCGVDVPVTVVHNHFQRFHHEEPA